MHLGRDEEKKKGEKMKYLLPKHIGSSISNLRGLTWLARTARCRRATLKPILGIILAVLFLHPGRFSCVHYKIVATEDIGKSLVTNVLYQPYNNKSQCQLDLQVLSDYQHLWHDNLTSGSEDEFANLRDITPGGKWSPKHCAAKYETVIFVPFRDRDQNLKQFLRLIHPFLQGQDISYSLWIVEQGPGKAFNRAKLFNIGKY